MNQQQQQRVLGRVLAQQFSAEERQIMQTNAAGGLGPPVKTVEVVHCLPYGFTDGIRYDGAVDPLDPVR